MNTPSVQLLLAEHARLRDIEKMLNERHARSLQRYMAIFTASAGLSALILEKAGSVSRPIPVIVLIISVVILLGEFTFINLFRQDNMSLEIAEPYNRIRRKFIEKDQTLNDVFLWPLTSSSKEFRTWAKLLSVIKRAFTVSGAKGPRRNNS